MEPSKSKGITPQQHTQQRPLPPTLRTVGRFIICSSGMDSGGDTASSWIGLHFTDWPVGSSATPEFQGDWPEVAATSIVSLYNMKNGLTVCWNITLSGSVEHGSGKRRSPGIDTKHRHQSQSFFSCYARTSITTWRRVVFDKTYMLVVFLMLSCHHKEFLPEGEMVSLLFPWPPEAPSAGQLRFLQQSAGKVSMTHTEK